MGRAGLLNRVQALIIRLSSSPREQAGLLLLCSPTQRSEKRTNIGSSLTQRQGNQNFFNASHQTQQTGELKYQIPIVQGSKNGRWFRTEQKVELK